MAQQNSSKPGRGRSSASVLEAAAKVFAEKGYHGTSTREIAGALDMTVAGLYFHYRSKEDLLYAISSLAHSEAIEVMRSAAANQADARDRLRAVVYRLVEHHVANVEFARVANLEIAPLGEENRATIVGLRRTVQQIVTEAVADGVRDGLMQCRDPEIVAVGILSLCIDLTRWYQPDRGWTAPRIATVYGDMALRMAQARDA